MAPTTAATDRLGTHTRRDALRVAGSGLAALGLAPLLSLAGVGSESAQAAAAASPSRGGVFTLGLISGGTTETLDPSKTGLWQDLPRLWNLYDSLYVRDASGNAAPLLVDTTEVSSDAKTWTLRLRSGVVWHDGKPLTADDLLYTVHTWSAPTHVGNGAVAPFIDFARVRKRDSLTVEIPLTLAAAQFPSILTSAPYVVVQNGSSTSTSKPVGTGPFRYKSFTPGEQSVFTANPHYWIPGLPYLDELVVNTSFTDDTARFNALLSGDIDAEGQLPFTLAKANESSGQITVLNAAGPAFQGFTMRVDSGETKDVRVRQALRLLVDRPAFIESVVDGYGEVSNDLVPAGTQYFATDLVRTQDIDQAKSLLKAAGKQDLRLTLATSAAGPGFVPAATLLQQQAQAAGVTIAFQQVQPAQYWSPGHWLSFPFGETFYDSLLTSVTQFYSIALHTGAPYNETHFGDPADNTLLFDAIGETDAALAEQKWHAVQSVQFERGGYLVWANSHYVDAIAKNVHGIVGSRAGSLGGLRFARTWLS